MKIEKLELRHICGYLPWGLKFMSELDKPFDEFGKNPIWTMNGISFLFGEHCANTEESSYAYPISQCKPLLLPLSALTEQLEDGTVPIDLFDVYEEDNFEYTNIKTYRLLESISKNNIVYDVKWLPVGVVEKLLEWHFDIYGLIDAGLAIDKRTVKI